MTRDSDNSRHNDVEFFGVKLKVKSPHLAALLNSSVTDDVEVIGRRALDAIAGEARAARPGASSEAPGLADEDGTRSPPDGSADVRLDGGS